MGSDRSLTGRYGTRYGTYSCLRDLRHHQPLTIHRRGLPNNRSRGTGLMAVPQPTSKGKVFSWRKGFYYLRFALIAYRGYQQRRQWLEVQEIGKLLQHQRITMDTSVSAKDVGDTVPTFGDTARRK